MRIRLAVAVLTLMVGTGLWAQEKQIQDPAESKELNDQAYVRLLRTDLKAKKEQIIKEAMQLTRSGPSTGSTTQNRLSSGMRSSRSSTITPRTLST
jgi:hypothetical protein